MKKIFLNYLLLLISFVGVLSCRQNEANDLDFSEKGKVTTVSAAKFSDLTEKELISKLVSDEDFINYGKNSFDFYESMPTKTSFLNFDVTTWEQKGIPYLAESSGYTNLEIENKFYKIASDLKTLQDKYPQLVYDGKNEVFINNVINEACNQINNDVWQKNGCADCRSKHRPRVIAAGILGGASGFLTGGVFGGASGAFTGFVKSVSAAASCFEAAGC